MRLNMGDRTEQLASAIQSAERGERPTLLLESRRPPVGRPFSPGPEKDLLPHLEALALGFSRPGKATLLLPELVLPFGVADLAVIIVGPAALRARLALNVPPILNDTDASILSVLGARPLRADTIAKRLDWPLSTVLRRVPILRRSGAILETRSGSYRSAGIGPMGQTIALEAKVKDWRGAIAQARTYGLWCDRSAVVLGKALSSWQDVTVAATNAHLGLAVEGSWTLRPPLRKLPQKQRIIASESFLAGLVGYRPT